MREKLTELEKRLLEAANIKAKPLVEDYQKRLSEILKEAGGYKMPVKDRSSVAVNGITVVTYAGHQQNKTHCGSGEAFIMDVQLNHEGYGDNKLPDWALGFVVAYQEREMKRIFDENVAAFMAVAST